MGFTMVLSVLGRIAGQEGEILPIHILGPELEAENKRGCRLQGRVLGNSTPGGVLHSWSIRMPAEPEG